MNGQSSPHTPEGPRKFVKRDKLGAN